MTTMHTGPMLVDATATPVHSLRTAARLMTGVLAIAMTASGIAFLIGPPGVIEALRALGYPSYFRFVLGPAKLLGATAVLGSRSTLREWAYAGFTFDLVGAIASHILAGGGPGDVVP